MEVQAFSELLTSLSACREATKWAAGKDLKTVWETCERGCVVAWRTNPDGPRAKRLC